MAGGHAGVLASREAGPRYRRTRRDRREVGVVRSWTWGKVAGEEGASSGTKTESREEEGRAVVLVRLPEAKDAPVPPFVRIEDRAEEK